MNDPSQRYAQLQFTDDEIATGKYKETIGGGSQEWTQRGKFQLLMLQELGLLPDHKFLDVGCGPGRTALAVANYLNADRYFGVDYQPDFIKAAKHAVAEIGLDTAKHPKFEVAHDFEYPYDVFDFDFCLLFSVLNWCAPEFRRKFLLNIVDRLNQNGRVLVTHAEWFEPSYLWSTGLTLNRELNDLQTDSTEFGWPKGQIFPVLELKRATS